MTTLQEKAIQAYKAKQEYENNKTNIDTTNLFIKITGLEPDSVNEGVVTKDGLKFWAREVWDELELKTTFLCTSCRTEREVGINSLAAIGTLLVKPFICYRCKEDNEQ